MTFLLAAVIALQMTLGDPVKVELHLMPPGTPLTLETGEEVRYFTFEEYKELLKMDAELWELKKQIELYSSIEERYKALLAEKSFMIEALEAERAILVARAERLRNRWKDCEEDLIDASGGSVWPWVTGAVGAVLGVIGLTLWLADDG